MPIGFTSFSKFRIIIGLLESIEKSFSNLLRGIFMHINAKVYEEFSRLRKAKFKRTRYIGQTAVPFIAIKILRI